MNDIVGNFHGDDAFTMYKTKRYPAWRPDKIVTKVVQPLKPIAVQICGNYNYISNDAPSEIQNDNYVRTPSDHLCLIADFNYI